MEEWSLQQIVKYPNPKTFLKTIIYSDECPMSLPVRDGYPGRSMYYKRSPGICMPKTSAKLNPLFFNTLERMSDFHCLRGMDIPDDHNLKDINTSCLAYSNGATSTDRSLAKLFR